MTSYDALIPMGWNDEIAQAFEALLSAGGTDLRPARIIRVDRGEVDAAMAHAASVGATILKPAEAVFWGGYRGYFADPDGYAWEVAHNPGWPLDDRGLPQLD